MGGVLEQKLTPALPTYKTLTPGRAGRPRPIADQGSHISEAKHQGWLSDLTSEERRAFARPGEFATHKQRGLAAIPRNLPRDDMACHDDPSRKGSNMTVVQKQDAPIGVRPHEVRIVAHTMLFYWWPVWAVGLLLAGLTWWDGHHLAIVPAGTQVVEGFDGGREALVLPAGAHLPRDRATGKPGEPTLRVASRSGYGVVFVVVLLLVVFITNVPIRGLWSVIVIVTVLLGTIILALADWWDDILESVVQSRVYINAFGYVAISLPLLVLWLVVALFFDRRRYMVFAPGQLRVCQEIGSGQVAYDTVGMVIAKRRSDVFRHWLLGFGSGDLLVKPAGANAHQFEVPNVLFVGNKLQLIQQMLKTREVASGA
jgi:hypothetical protein